jgi:hypothetical protein
MRMVSLAAVTGGLALMATAACGGGGNNGGSTNTGTKTGGGGTAAWSCPDSLAEAPNSEFCAGSPATPDCTLITPSYHDQVCGVAILAPTAELARSPSVKEYAGNGPPQLDCLDPAHYPTKGTPQTVTMKGLVKMFSNGCETKNVEVTVFEVVDGEKSSSPMGTPVVTPSDCKVDGVASDDPNTCGTRYECHYTYPGVKTETELVVLTKGTDWAPLYTYNVYIPNDEVQSGAWNHDVRALANDDYTSIPQTVGTTIAPGNGALAGEVHDCGDVRLQNATVDIDVSKYQLYYFTDNETHPLPTLASTMTSVLGLYAALDVPAGKARVAALGLVNGKVTTLGFHLVEVFPDSVTSVTIRGVRPYQVPSN